MAAPRNLTGDSNGRFVKDEERGEEKEEDKKSKLERFPLNRWEFAAALAVFFVFSAGLLCIYLTMPSAEYGNIKLPRTIPDLRILKYLNTFPSITIIYFPSIFYAFKFQLSWLHGKQ